MGGPYLEIHQQIIKPKTLDQDFDLDRAVDRLMLADEKLAPLVNDLFSAPDEDALHAPLLKWRIDTNQRNMALVKNEMKFKNRSRLFFFSSLIFRIIRCQ